MIESKISAGNFGDATPSNLGSKNGSGHRNL
jgi:hypothetical protein